MEDLVAPLLSYRFCYITFPRRQRAYMRPSDLVRFRSDRGTGRCVDEDLAPPRLGLRIASDTPPVTLC